MDSASVRILFGFLPQEIVYLKRFFNLNPDPSITPLLEDLSPHELEVLHKIIHHINNIRRKPRKIIPRNMRIICPQCGRLITRAVRNRG